MLLGDLIFIAVAVYLLAWLTCLLAPPVLRSLRTPGESSQEDPRHSRTPQISVVIPTHDMEDCIKPLLGSRCPGERLQVYVVADHRSDEN